MSGILKSVGKIAPIAAAFIPGIGPLAAAGIGAAGGALSGGGLKGALLGGAGGYIGAGGLGSQISSATGLSGAGLNTVQKGLGGAIAGSSDGLKGALLGGGLGAAGGFLGSALGDTYGAIEAGDAAGANLFDRAAGSLAGSGIGQTLSGGLNAVTGGLTSGGAEGAGIGGGNSSFLSKAATVGGLLNSGMANSEIEDQLLEQQRRSEEALNPYLTAGRQGNERLSFLLGLSGDPSAEGYGSLGEKFNPGDLTQDPGYQFALQQGQQGIDRSLGSRGKMFSGEALKEASQFNQGLADQFYNDAYNRWRTGQQDIYNRYAGVAGTGQNAAGTLSGVYDNIGNVQANTTMNQSNLINQGLSQLLGAGLIQNGTQSQRRIIGYDAQNNPIYEDQMTSMYGSA